MTSTRTKLAAALAAAALSTAAAAKVQTKQITYKQGDTPLVGYLAWDDAAHGKRPGVLIVHEWWGMNDHARAQAAAVVTFHGVLKPWTPAPAPGSIKPAILVQAGGSDPMVPASAVQAVEKELKDAGAKVNVIVYPEAKHAFTNPDAGKAGMDGLAYDARADRASWAAAVAFLKQVLGT